MCKTIPWPKSQNLGIYKLFSFFNNILLGLISLCIIFIECIKSAGAKVSQFGAATATLLQMRKRARLRKNLFIF